MEATIPQTTTTTTTRTKRRRLFLFWWILEASTAFPSQTITHSSLSLQQSSSRWLRRPLFSSSSDDDDDTDNGLFLDATTLPSSSSSSSAAAEFGDVTPLKRPVSTSASEAQFGDVVSLRDNNNNNKRNTSSSSSSSSSTTTITMSQKNKDEEVEDRVQDRRQTNILIAVLSIALAILNYFWQYTHPIPPIQLLYSMEQSSAPITTIGNSDKPTVVDFWAPWCENCKQMAGTLASVESEYNKDVNFVMVNGDDPAAWPLIEAFGVDAIPHLALVESDGTVDTALIGPVPKQWLEADLAVLIANSKQTTATSTTTTTAQQTQGQPTQPRQALPYQMLDVFANRPDQRRIQVKLATPEDPSKSD